MRRPTCPDGQVDLFAPEVMSMIFAHPKPAAPPNLALPFPRNEEIDSARAAGILGVSLFTLRRFAANDTIKGCYAIGVRKGTLRIPYGGLIDYCNELRVAAGVPPLKLPGKGRRLPDRDLLPFSPEHAVAIEKVMTVLDIGRIAALHLVEEGAFSAYRLVPGSPWRIDVRSLEIYLQTKREEASGARITVRTRRHP